MRRRWFLGACVASTFVGRQAVASPRIPFGGKLSMRVPWPVSRMDPHAADDAMAACFGGALFGTLYADDERGGVRPALADGLPEAVGDGLRVSLRPGLVFASGRPLDAATAAWSLERSRGRGAGAWLARVPPARVSGDGLVFRTRDAQELARTLASPFTAVLPRRFSPEAPDGSGPFRAEAASGDGLRLVRNNLCPEGPSYLDAIHVLPATDVTASLRAFESGADDVGWLGSFLHEPRTGAAEFDGGAIGWVVLRTGRDAGTLDVPGMAQALADGVRYEALAPLMVGPRWATTPAQWTGNPCDVRVRDDAPWLVEVARSVAASLSAPSHEVSPRPCSAVELVQRRAARDFALMIDVVCAPSSGNYPALLALAAADDPHAGVAIATHPPHAAPAPRAATRTLRVGVIGEIRIQGGRAADVVLVGAASGRGIDWGSSYRARPGMHA